MNTRDLRGIPTQQFRPPQIPPSAIGIGILIVLLLLAAWNTVYTVDPEEVGVVLTFGKYTAQTKPGLRFKWPYPIQQVVKVPVERQLKQEFGFRTTRADIRSTLAKSGFGDESLMLTGDLNVAVVEWTTQYRIDKPEEYLFRVREMDDTFRSMNEAVMRAVIGDRSVTEVLTVGRQEIGTEVERQLQELCDQYESGIRVDQIVLRSVTVPDEVKASFNEVNQAQQERERMINEARSEFNRAVPRARGEALQLIQEAEGYATDRVNRSEGDAALFESLLEAYNRAPDVTRRRIYLETMQDVMPRVKRKIFLDDDLKGLVPLLSLDQGGGKP